MPGSKTPVYSLIDSHLYHADFTKQQQFYLTAFATQLAEPTQSINAAVEPFVDREELAGAVMLVADKSRILGHSAVGFADIAQHQPMRPDSLFWIASQSKPITAAALMMLVDEGSVNVEDPVEKYLPEFHGQMVVVEKDEEHVLLKKPSHPITVKNVLSHTSGLPFRSELEQPTLDRLPLADRVRSYAMTPLDFEPNTKYQYSNAGINTAARIIEVVSGMTFERFLDERLFRPLGMSDTTFWPSETQAARIAKSYKPGKNNNGLEEATISQIQYPLTDRANRYPMPAGGLFSSAADLAKFYQMVANGGQVEGRRYLSDASVQQMTSRQTPDSLPNNYGFGFSTGGNQIGHGGAYSTNSYFDRQHGLILIWLVQHAGFPGDGAKAQDAFRQAVLTNFVN
ncbi:MAG: beta-lactamase family protein [Planctomycetaceae bacterium]|nr:beta-lactamase family protein [Planctomycetaceae bacterium]